MNSVQLHRMVEAAGVISRVIGRDFQWEPPGSRRFGVGSLMVLLHEPSDPLRPYCNYDCREYDKIQKLSDALAKIDLFVEGCTGDYSGVYEITGTRGGDQ